MIQHLRPRSKLCCAPVHDLIHGADRRNDLRLDLFCRNPPRARVRRRLSSFWQIPEPNHHHRLCAILPAGLRRQRLVSREPHVRSLSSSLCKSNTDAPGFQPSTISPPRASSTALGTVLPPPTRSPAAVFVGEGPRAPLNFSGLSDRMLPQL